jgi:PAS domain S-box-containing protein
MPDLPSLPDARVAALRDYGVLDTPREPAFDDLVALAQMICGTRYAVVNLVDAHRQWFKAEIGFGVSELPLDDSICAQVMLEPDFVEIPDLRLDDRFACNPLVTAGPELRFYAGAPLRNDAGHVLGTLCVLDVEPRRLDETQRRSLASLGRQVVSLMELRRSTIENARHARSLAEALDARDAAQAELVARDAAHRFVIERVLAGLVVHDASGAIMLANEAASRLLGLTRDQLLGRTPTDPAWHFVREDGTPMPLEEYPISIVARDREPLLDHVVGVVPHEGADTVWVLVNAYPELAAAGALERTVVSFVDITARKRIEAALRESEERFRSITNAVPQMIWAAQPDGYADYFSRQWYEFTGTREGENDGAGWVGLVHPDDRAIARAAWERSTRTGQAYEVEYRLRHCSGTHRWVLARGVPVRDADGAIERWMGTCTDIHEQKLVQSALERSEDALRQADRRKDEFLAMLAHELRNPLAPITTASELLRLAGSDASRVRSASEIISRQVRHMTGLVDDLLDVSRVTRGLVQLQTDVFDLRVAARAAVEQVGPLVESRRHALSIDEPEGALWLNGDATRVTQIIANLLNNAAKYTPPGGRIALRLRRDRDRVRIEVEDSGQGIAADLLPHVFDLFTQGARAIDRSQGGLGIGLALVRSLAALHGGQVSAHSAGPGCGSRFEVDLPAAAAAPARADHAPVDPPAAVHSLDIVVVDDNVDAAQTLALLLELEGHRVRTLATATEALTLPADDPTRVFVLDIGLPDVSGHELARRLRRTPQGQDALLYALSGYGQAQDLAASIDAGFDRHFVKPLQLQVLLDALAADLNHAQPRGRIADRSKPQDTV